MKQTSGADNVHVQMSQAGGNCERHHNHAVHVDRACCKEIKQRTILMKIGD